MTDNALMIKMRKTLAERPGVEPGEPLRALQISNLLHYHPAPAPRETRGLTAGGDGVIW